MTMADDSARSVDVIGRYLREIGAIPLLTPAEEIELARRAKSGDERAVEELVRHNLRLVISVAKQYAKYGVPFEDLINEGNLGLIHAAQRFDVDRGYRYISYAMWWVRQRILLCVADHARTVRLPSNKSWRLRRVTRVTERLRHVLGRDPTTDELAKHLKMKPEDVEKVANLPRWYFSIDQPAEGNDHEFRVDTLTDETTPGPEDTMLEIKRNEDIEQALSALDPRQADVMKRYYGLNGFQPHSLAQIGAVYGLTRERVRQIRNQAIGRLRTSVEGAKLAEYAQ